jgi:hypothetical protein
MRQWALRRPCADPRGQHGSPLFPWDNWANRQDARPRDFDIDYRDVRYFSDTGRTWHPTRHNLRDRVGTAPEEAVDTTDELIALIRTRRYLRLCLLAHPERWAASAGAWILRAGRDVLENGIKAALGRAYGPRGGQPA